jgi:thiamine biosynthesis lipoprotein
MVNDEAPPSGLGIHPVSSAYTHRFAHNAMATIFEIICAHEDRRYAEQAALAGFDLLDRIETELTCHRGGSDIFRINHLRSGEMTVVGAWTMECLLLAQQFYSETAGAFDVSLGSGLDLIELIPEDSCVRVREDTVRLNLGGIGKGYAIDRVHELLDDWEIKQALIHGGFSSVLVLDPPPGQEGWPLTISAPPLATDRVLERFLARRQSWSASGLRKKDHIVNPRTGKPVSDRPAVWASGTLKSLGVAQSAAFRTTASQRDAAACPAPQMPKSPSAAAEALSTAAMVMSLDEIAAWCLKHPGVEVRVLTSDPSNPAASPELLHFQAGLGDQ